LGAASREMKRHVIRMGVGIPLTQRDIDENPDLLLTPVFKKFLSLLLEFHLPAACPHARIRHQCTRQGTSFVCWQCRGAIKYKRSMLMPLCNVAFCTSIPGEKALRIRCLNFIRDTEQPVVSTLSAGGMTVDLRQGHVCEVILKAESPKENRSALPAPDSVLTRNATCTCEACRRSMGNYASDDEFFEPGEARMGRRKSRRGTKPSRLQHMLCMESCENDCQS